MRHEVREQETQTISHTLHICFCQDTKNTYQANRAFMQGITIHEARSEAAGGRGHRLHAAC